MPPSVQEPSEYHASTFSTKSGQHTNRQRAIDKTKYQLQLGTILLFKCHGIRMQFVMVFSAQRQHKKVMRFCTHSTLTMTNQVMRIVGWLTTTCTRLRLNPARVLFINPATTFGAVT
uniref:Uncharacterized protein n=1 Tax=Escherichia coli TaxID=562 RepID=Q8KTV8_ECOLX|nr:unknown [Escherichia coli]